MTATEYPRLAEALNDFAQSAGRDGIRKLIISRDKRLVYSGPDVDAAQGVWSITKTFLGLTLGLLVDDGRVALDQKAASVVPELATVFPEVTIRQLASMTSGYLAVGDETPIKGYAHGPSLTPFSPASRPQFPPGTAFSYWDSAPNMLALILTKVAGRPLIEVFRSRIADPLAMPVIWGSWLHDGLAVNGGSGNHYGPVQTTARALLHLGELLLDEGEWRGQTLLSRAFCHEARQPVAGCDVPLFVDLFDGRGRYGLYLWLNGKDRHGNLKWPGVEPGTFSAAGYNNNDLFVLPEARLVVVRLGMDQDTEGAISDATYAALLRGIVDAVSA